MSHFTISTSKEPIRLFKSNFLEFFTHIHPVAIVIIWLPVAVYAMLQSIKTPSALGWGHIPLAFLLGLVVWTFTEYSLHRFLFHFIPHGKVQERISFLFHGIHHVQPQVKTRLVMPPAVSIPMAAIIFGLFYLLFSIIPGAKPWLGAFFAAFLVGYLIYDLMHYATHHLPMRKGIFKYLKRYHNQHHYKTPDARFGVSSPLWDHIFRTFPDPNDNTKIPSMVERKPHHKP